MKKKILAIVDQEMGYIRQMGAYFGQKGFSSFQVMTFSNLDAFLEYCGVQQAGVNVSDEVNNNSFNSGTKKITILLMGEKTFGELKKRKAPAQYFGEPKPITLPVEKMMILQEEGLLLPEQMQMNGKQLESIYKYQSMDSISREVMERFAKDESCKGVMTGGRKKTRIIGFYTPGGDVWNSAAAVAIGQILAEKEKVFYLNFQRYSSLGEWFGEMEKPDGDLSDLIYFLRNQREKLMFKLEGMEKKLNGMEYIHPIPFAEDLEQIPKKEWLDFLHDLCYASEFDTLILDLGDGMDGIIELINECDVLYTIVRENIISKMKQDKFREWCQRKEEEDLLEIIQVINISDTEKIPDKASLLLQHPIVDSLKRMVRE